MKLVMIVRSQPVLFLLFLSTAIAACTGTEDEASVCVGGDNALTVTSTSIEDDQLTVQVEYTGGCEEHDFEVWWGGVYAPSIPPVLPLEIQHYANGDTCEALVQDSFKIDLAALFELQIPKIRLQLMLGEGGGTTLTEVLYETSRPGTTTDSGIAIRTECGTILY